LILSGGGEPTLHPEIEKIISTASKKGIKVGLITNGLNLTKELQKIILKNCSWVRISFDSAVPENYKRIRGVNTSEKVYKNLHDLVRLKYKLKSSCTIGAQAVVTKHNVRDLYLTGMALAQIGVDYFQMRPLENEHYSKEFYDIAMQEMQFTQQKISDLHCIISGKWKIINPHTDLGDRGYKACWCYPFIGAITVDGNIYICCHFVGIDKFCYGNMITDTPEDILKNRESAAKNINLKYCPAACRGNQINIRLEGLLRGCEHKEFL
jgi:radical SAM protein with 4Fe4S-binding SPASM domain